MQEVEVSGSRASAKPILCLSERNEEDTDWTRAIGTKPASGKNKMPVEAMARVRQRKELIRESVAKNQVVDRWLSDNIKAERWERIAGAFPHGNKHSPKQQWVIMTEDTKTPSPYRYQQYGITVKLNPDNTDKLHATFLSLPKTYHGPTLWICSGHHDCMVVYDVTNTCDTHVGVAECCCRQQEQRAGCE